MSKPTIFMSHSHHDNVWCRCFVAVLQGAGYDVWYDEKGMGAGSDWVEVIQRELIARDLFLIILSPLAWESYWVQEELKLAFTKRRHIVPVLHQPTPQADGWILNRQWIDVVGQDCATAGRTVAAAIAKIPVQSTPTTPSIPQPVAPALPGVAAPILPRLKDLGFMARAIDGVEVIIPPVCDVPPGEFLMGSDKAKDPQAFGDETPQYAIPMDHAYQIGTFPITVAEYAWYLKANPQIPVPPSYTYPKDASWAAPEWRGKELTWAKQQERPEHPIVQVSWTNARDYAVWLAQVTKQHWRLPTEAEWEKAARGTDGRLYPWGNQWDKARANTSDGGPQTTTPVGTYRGKDDASPFGAHDLAGNVWEWTSTLWGSSYPYRNSDSREDANSISNRVLRGGSWDYVPRYARVASRVRDWIVSLSSFVGFRLVRVARAGS